MESTPRGLVLLRYLNKTQTRPPVWTPLILAGRLLERTCTQRPVAFTLPRAPRPIVHACYRVGHAQVNGEASFMIYQDNGQSWLSRETRSFFFTF